MTDPALVLQSITRTYGRGDGAIRALDGVDLTIESGEFVAITGPSGSGKSSLLNVLGCLDTPSSGHLLIDGTAVSELPARRLAAIRNRRIGFVFQSFHLIPSMTAQGNVELPMAYAGVPRADRRRRARDALERVGLAGRTTHRPAQLSGGQQQRVAVARAIVNEPAFVLADEPTGNLDSAATEDVLRIVEMLHREGTTIVLITHEEDVAARADRIVRMRDGRIEVAAGAAR